MEKPSKDSIGREGVREGVRERAADISSDSRADSRRLNDRRTPGRGYDTSGRPAPAIRSIGRGLTTPPVGETPNRSVPKPKIETEHLGIARLTQSEP